MPAAGDFPFVPPRSSRHVAPVTRLAEIQQAILRLDPVEQQSLRHWLDEVAEETPAMLAALDQGLDSLVQEGGVPISDARARLRQWTTG
jgi:hypothetical protein